MLLGIAWFSALSMTQNKVSQMKNVEINMSDVADGVYRGYSDGGLVQVEVSVTVKEYRIINIELLKHENGMGTPAETIIEDMLIKNTDNVDAVSGATISSETIRNAVNKALQQGL